ncbi:MAG: LLM class flavin-dependent oxidoreductase [Candidatus Dormibacteraeota bacterium]|nr:LLM class flavin-dependent oxidoreductase [Candidatus Dormibacteraeota bacterium]
MKPIGIALPGAATPAEAGRLAARAELLGFDAVWALDVRREPFLTCAAAIASTSRISVGTNVAVAFARSPTVTATAAWDLALWSGGRFVLGLGTQVGPALQARFGVSVDRPGPRLRDYVLAVRACFAAFRRGYGRYDGEFYSIRRPAFQPGSEPGVPEPPIYIAAVNPFMTGIAGQVGDGLAAHPFTTPDYLRKVMLPALAAGATRAERVRPRILQQLVVAPSRRLAAAQMLVYTVPSYRRVLDHAGQSQMADAVLAAVQAGRRSEARTMIESGYLDLLGVVIGVDQESIRQGLQRWLPLADFISLSVPWFGVPHAEQMSLMEGLLEQVAPLNLA